ncbi:hypothetical protein [Nocardiopsis sp. JB363]|uniref:hypothetical protein n=1 Tax=Nocardiopsis sp. JB363 TaxID=1434837 RepID=UPI00097B3872|nr:hypothetical protein [Nocardiopsis sp. JB363]SIO85980.1 hypothetical protein BQ8420_09685 [Nocardiopsis sp. JB363]
MVVDAVRTYLDAANGLTELSRKEAVSAAKALLRAGGAGGSPPPAGDGAQGPPPRVGQNIQALAGELIETSQANRAAIADLVRAEVGHALEQMDMVPRAEHERVVRRVAELERRLGARHAVERALAPRDGASSVLPVREEPVEPTEPAEPEPVAKPEPAPRETASAEPSTPRPKTGGTGATTKNTRSRSTAKRTTKGKSAKK